MKSAGKFVVQRHTRPGDVHWDWMFEATDTLETWRIAVPPEDAVTQAFTAIKIFAHPLKFLTYQGSVNNGAGTVKIADHGTYRLISQNERLCEMELQGETLKGRLIMRQIEAEQWEFSFSLTR